MIFIVFLMNSVLIKRARDPRFNEIHSILMNSLLISLLKRARDPRFQCLVRVLTLNFSGGPGGRVV